jgi:predicted AAA+ superfamily ATPase
MIKRKLHPEICKRLYSGKAIIVMGGRQTGKTTLLQQIIKGEEGALWLTASMNPKPEESYNGISTMVQLDK